MEIGELSEYLSKLDNTSSRLEITDLLSSLFKESRDDEIAKTCYLILGSLAPSYKNIVFNMAEKLMLQAVAKVFDISPDYLKTQYKKIGDMGELVNSLSSSLSLGLSVSLSKKTNTRKQSTDESKVKKLKDGKTKKLTVLEVYDKLLEIAEEEGEESVERKIDKTAELLRNLDPLSAKYVSRIMMGKLRLGFSDKTMIDALSWMETGNKSKSNMIEEAYNVLPDIGILAENIKKFKIEKAVKNVVPVVGVPVLPALAQRLKSPKEMIEKMGQVAIEPKFDGLRIQIHVKKLKIKSQKSKAKIHNSKFIIQNSFVKAFTRNMNETSWMFPELNNIADFINADEVILDSEAVGVDEVRKTMANFQTTMTRRRKYEIEEITKKVGIKFFVFDVLSKNGVNIMDKNYLERKEILRGIIKDGGCLTYVDHIITDNPSVIEQEMKKKLKGGLEGIIVKKTNAHYVSGRTGWRWVKMKEEESAKAKLADTIDCVVMGYFKGKGKRAGFGIGGMLVGIRNYESGIMKKSPKQKDREEVLTLTKLGTGLTDEQFRNMNARLEKLVCNEKPKEYGKVDTTLVPDVWVIPSLVIEIAADAITKSPSQSSGYSLRFPRLVRIREDKGVNDATTIEEIEEMVGNDK